MARGKETRTLIASDIQYSKDLFKDIDDKLLYARTAEELDM